MEKQQTAVEFLADFFESGVTSSEEWTRAKEQAKEMEKEQIIAAHLTGLIHPLEMEATKQAEQYYNETFKSE
jgi:uncharacterized glyoxalase superfamily protein PhnB